jgi:translation initiation factor 2 subunit 2
VVETLTKYNPDLGEKTKIAIQPPQVIKQGAKKTAITNFQNICHTLNRHPDHVMNFIL